MHEGTLIEQLIESVERAEEHALETLEAMEAAGPQPKVVYEMARQEQMIGVA